METVKMTIHRALSELKILDSKIAKSILSIDPIGLMQKDKLVNRIQPEEEFIQSVKSKYQSTTDLINRKVKIKSAIVKANAETKVKIGDVEMTISDAINFKMVIQNKKSLIDRLENRYKRTIGEYLTHNEQVNEKALENAKVILGKQEDNKVRPTDKDVDAIVSPFVERNELHLVDPLKVEELITKLQAEVDDFEVDVDAVLSEANSTTLIEI